MTPQQALEEAKKRYPEGTRYRCAVDTWYESIVESTGGFSIYKRKYIHGEDGKGVLYNIETDTWAEIIQPAKSLEERLVEEYGFGKDGFDHGEFKTNRYVKEGLTIDFDYEGEDLVSVNGIIELTSFQNPKNLEAFIKAYLGLFEK